MVTISSSQPCAIDGRVEPRREVRQTAAMPDIRPVRQEQRELDALDPNAGETRGEFIVADGVDAAAEIRRMQQEAEEDRRDGEEHELEGKDPEDIALAEIGEGSRIAAIGLVAEDDIGDAAEQAHRADGDDDGRQAEVRRRECR